MECLTLSIARTCEVLGVGRTTIYSKIATNELVVVKIGRRTLITAASVKALVGQKFTGPIPVPFFHILSLPIR
jgi:excisionase family DNA binding protein